jgi:hypothetical protein
MPGVEYDQSGLLSVETKFRFAEDLEPIQKG